MEKFVRDSLSKILDCVVTDQMMSAILNIKDDYEFDNYFGNLLSEDNEEHRLFLLNCRRMLLSGKQPRNNGKSSSSKPPTSTTPVKGGGSSSNSGVKAKPGKFVNLYANDGKVLGDTILLKGRRSCECQAAQHKLINNCLGCGRIVCEQEGSGPCLFCGESVFTTEEMMRLAKAAKGEAKPNVKPATKQGKKSKDSGKDLAAKEAAAKESLEKALAQRDRLLEYDKNSEKRTTVIDDELDYFQENSVWLSKVEREKFEKLKGEMHEMKHGSRLNRKIRVDFAGRELPEDLPVSKEYEQQVINELAAVTKAAGGATNWSSSSFLTGHSAMALAPISDMAKPPVYKISKEAKSWPAPASMATDGLEQIYNRVQDKELLEMQDMRQCLSMHQPWASLLVAGIKKHEGRVWYSEHRGRLWIASTSKEAHAEDIAQMEEFYRVIYDDPNINFPSHYPTASLLGCVHVDSCLPQEEYREIYPNGESDSPYVFVCSKPEQLNILLPVKGDHKIYELPLKTHSAACKTLLRARANKG